MICPGSFHKFVRIIHFSYNNTPRDRLRDNYFYYILRGTLFLRTNVHNQTEHTYRYRLLGNNYSIKSKNFYYGSIKTHFLNSL